MDRMLAFPELIDLCDFRRASLRAVRCGRSVGAPVMRPAKELHYIADLRDVLCRFFGRCLRSLLFGGCCIEHVLDPLLHPWAVPVLKHNLQIVRFVGLVVRVGQRFEIAFDIVCDIHALKGQAGRSPSCGIAHRLTFFQGGMLSMSVVAASTSGRFRTIPAGNV